MNFHHIKDLIPKAMQKYGIPTECKASHICHLYSKIAPSIWGDDVLKYSSANNFKRGQLTIGVINSTWMQEIQLRKHLLLNKINDEVEKNVVQNIRLVMGVKKNDFPAEES